MVSIPGGAVGIDAGALIVETARVFGFAKTGSSIRDALEAVLRSLVIAGRLNATEGHGSVAGA